jgi:Delta7-sterol 5-desaturase
MTWDKFILLLLDNAVKYFFISLPFFLVYYIFFRKKLSYKKIQVKFPKLKDYARELGFSTLSVIIFSLPPLIMLYSDLIRPHTTFYTHIDEHGTVYFVLAFPLTHIAAILTGNEQ